ncbi:MAG: hypothetical protein AcusKO_18190 [Acuticoccus sp.]
MFHLTDNTAARNRIRNPWWTVRTPGASVPPMLDSMLIRLARAPSPARVLVPIVALAFVCAAGALRPAGEAQAADGAVRVAQGARALPIDGTWRLVGQNQRVRIHNGRGFDGRIGTALSRDIRETGRGRFSLFDLKCNCRAQMSLTVEGTLAGISYTLAGAVPWELEPIRLRDRGWFEDLLLGLG